MLVSIRDREPSEVVSRIPSDRWDIEMATVHATYPATKLQTDNLGDYARAYGQRQSQTRIEASYNFADTEDVKIDYVSVLGINRDIPTPPPVADVIFQPNRARLIIDYFGKIIHIPEVQPGGFSLTNLTGDIENLNQVLNPPEEAIVGGYIPLALIATSHTLNTSVTVEMGNNSQRPYASGVDGQEFLIHVRDSIDSESFPTIVTTLRQSGSDVATLAYEDIQQTSEGFIYRYLWNSSILSSATLPIQIRVDGTTTGTSTVEPLTISWRASVTGTLYDSGWSDLPKSDSVTWVPDLTFDPGAFNVIVQFSDFGYISPLSIVNPLGGMVGIFTYVPLGESFHAGRFLAGTALNLPLAEIGGFNVRKSGNNQNSLISSYGGHLRASRNDLTRWEADFIVRPQSQTRLFSTLDQFFKDVGFILPCLCIPDESNVSTALWGLITSWDNGDMGSLVGTDFPGDAETTDQRFDFKFSIMEAAANPTRRAE